MGSDLYIHIQTGWRDADAVVHWSSLFEGPSRALDRGIVVVAFGDSDPGKKPGYLTHAEIVEGAEQADCPWRHDEPYWVRRVPGGEFVDIVRERRWRLLQDGDFRDTECSVELRAFANLVECLLNNGSEVRVFCWHSQ